MTKETNMDLDTTIGDLIAAKLTEAPIPSRGGVTFHRLPLGQLVIVRTVTMYYAGKLVEADDDWLVLEDAAWVADTGRWSTFLATGSTNEIEPYPDGPVWLNRGAIVDLCVWPHAPLRVVK